MPVHFDDEAQAGLLRTIIGSIPPDPRLQPWVAAALTPEHRDIRLRNMGGSLSPDAMTSVMREIHDGVDDEVWADIRTRMPDLAALVARSNGPPAGSDRRAVDQPGGRFTGELTETDEETVRSTVEQWTSCLQASDWERWIDFYEPDAELLVPGEPRLGGHEAISGYVRANFASLSGFRFERWQIIGIGDLAVVDNDIVFWDDGGEQDGTSAKQIIVLRRHDDGRWRMRWVAFSTRVEGEESLCSRTPTTSPLPSSTRRRRSSSSRCSVSASRTWRSSTAAPPPSTWG